MQGDALGIKIMQEINALSNEDKAEREKVFKAIGKAIVEYLRQNATVLPGISVQVDPNTGAGSTTGTGRVG